MQWVTARRCRWSARCCRTRCAIHIACRTYKSRPTERYGRAAKDYLINLCEAANGAVVDMIMPGWQDYALTHRSHVHRGVGRQAPEEALKKANAEWDVTTAQRLGVAAQKAAYEQFLKLPGSLSPTTRSRSSVRSVH